MTRKIAPKDQKIICLMQKQGLIKREAQQLLKKQVYKLSKSEVDKVNNYAHHFGFSVKEKFIEEILDLRRDALLEKYQSVERDD
ncbi:hypothetical protein FCU94_17885 [Vibrio sp. JPW-9-11-11]|uniref:hypothetical protein n=1 Tax=Vibrio sp. JPW-9-11-11 TaxID=1416532 RepID=UPI001593C17E|nr:hypothetical protein [Vibrio sp. JPW-9-11-11]NVD08721.1 hypothetical protein [Vibrio sp. JPW-9-11-11]